MNTNKKIFEDYISLETKTDISQIIEKAEEAMQGMLVLNGTGAHAVFVGDPPQWEKNEYGVGGYTWTMSRLIYMNTLCKAFLITGERRYLEKVESDLENWIDTVPPPPVPHDRVSANVYHGIHNWRMLELGYRMIYTFQVLLPVLKEYGSSGELINKLKSSISIHGERISKGSHLLWPNFDHNHYLEEITGLLGAVAMIPENPKAYEWAAVAIEGLECAGKNQITEDGGQIEGASLYHNASVINLCMGLHFAEKLNLQLSKGYISRLKKGIDYSVVIFKPNGEVVTIGDSDPNDTSIECAVLGYLLFGEEKWLAHISIFVDSVRIYKAAAKCSWGFPNVLKLISALEAGKFKSLPLFPVVNYQRELGQAYFWSGWDREALYLAFICKSPVHYGNHGHMDQLGFDFTAYGKTLLRDPGRFTYKDCEDRHLYKSSAFHNVPTINGRDTLQYISTFAYGEKQEPGGINLVVSNCRVKGARGSHMNYFPANVERSIALIDDKFLLIADKFIGVGGERAEIYFHTDSLNVSADNNIVFTNDPGVNISIYSTINSSSLMDGRISDEFYHDYPSTRAVFTENITGDIYMAVSVVIPWKNAAIELYDLKVADEKIKFSLEGCLYNISLDEKEIFIV